MEHTVTLNDALVLSCPDGFRVLDAAERGKLNFLEDGPGEVLSDPERHIMISVGWKALTGLSARLLSTKDAAKNMEAKIGKAMRAYGCRADGSAAKAVGSETAEGFRYEYEAQGIGMYAEAWVVKHEKVFYYLNFYARQERKSESLNIWDAVIASAKWI